MQSLRGELEKQGQWRELKKLEALDFCSNDYLGLAKDARLRSSLIEFLQKDIPLGSSASRLIPGHHHWHLETEFFLAEFFNSGSGLIFNSGYAANTGLLSTLGRESVIFSDELNHASIIDGIRLSKGRCRIFRHNDLSHLEELLREETGETKLIVTESLFSMDGDFAPLQELSDLAEKYEALLIVDEAHASGVYGPHGEGLIAELGLPRENVVSVHTFGKAFGAFGAFVACGRETKELLVNFCRDLIYTTALPPHMVWQMTESVRLVKSDRDLRDKLKMNAEFLRSGLRPLVAGKCQSQIVPVVLGNNDKVLRASQRLLANGFQVGAIRSPTVAKNQERLRICVHADHRPEDLERLASIVLEGA